MGSGTSYSKINCRPWFKFVLLGGGWFHWRGNHFPARLSSTPRAYLTAHSTELALTGLIFASITLQASLNRLLTDALCLPFKTRGYTLAVGPP